MEKSNLKEHLFSQCEEAVNNRLESIQKTIAAIQESLLNETKSTAGDKHETGRAMAQLEREKAGRQLAEVQKLHQILCKIDLSDAEQVKLGSLVYTTQANYFIAISVGQLTVDDQTFFAIAANTPIGKLLVGKKAGETVTFNGKSITIKNIK